MRIKASWEIEMVIIFGTNRSSKNAACLSHMVPFTMQKCKSVDKDRFWMGKCHHYKIVPHFEPKK